MTKTNGNSDDGFKHKGIFVEGGCLEMKKRKVDEEDSEEDSDDDFEPSLLVKAVIAKASTFPDMNEVPTERTESDEEGLGEFDDFEMPPRDEPLAFIPPLRPEKENRNTSSTRQTKESTEHSDKKAQITKESDSSKTNEKENR